MDQNIISIQEADDHLRLSLNSPDPRRADLESKLDAAVAFVYSILKQPVPSMTDSPQPVIDHQVRAAILIALAGLWDGRDPSVEIFSSDFWGDKPNPIFSLLSRNRDPSMA